MTLAFIIAAVIAGILFLLWESGREKLIESEGKISQLKNRIDELANDPSRAVYGRQTLLTPELMHDVVRNNGFYPFQKEEWISFKWQGEQYFISANTLPGIQFYKGFSYGSDTDLELLKKSAEEAMEETWYGRITFSEEYSTIAFRVFAVEKSVEHFTDSFMDYMKMLDHLIECHRYFYQKNVDEKKPLTLSLDQDKLVIKETKVLS
ncbi:MAG: hypothetical protein IJZ70_06665 [Bacteroidales bacterium]|nr:hypothetical protein [Bacteroidales bacterium]MBQ8811975.1 hypothetical protein [Bacteroidales bacterium]